MNKLIANEDYTLDVTPSGGWSPNGTETPTPASRASATGGKKMVINKIGWTPMGCTLAGCTWSSGFSMGVSATAAKVKADGLPVVREGDTGICNGSFTNNSSGATVPCSCSLEVSSAGQTKAKAK